MSEKNIPEEITPLARLGQAFHFSGEDLQLNRRGKLSEAQRRFLLHLFGRGLLLALSLWALPALIGLILVWWGKDEAFPTLLFEEEAALGYLVGFLLSAIYCLVNLNQFLLLVDVMDGRVKTVKGIVQRIGFYLEIQEQRFLVEAHVLDLIQSGLHYRFYFSPYARRLLSVEFAE